MEEKRLLALIKYAKQSTHPNYSIYDFQNYTEFDIKNLSKKESELVQIIIDKTYSVLMSRLFDNEISQSEIKAIEIILNRDYPDKVETVEEKEVVISFEKKD